MHKFPLLVYFLLLPFLSFSQQKEMRSMPEDTLLNQYDAGGRKQGLWLTFTPPAMGEPGTYVFGSYTHGNKTGSWYKINKAGDLISMETFRNNVLDGEAKYYQLGYLYCIGHYRGLNTSRKYDTIMVMHPITQEEAYRVIATEWGTMRHGLWKYFDPQSGKLVRVEEYQVDELVYKKDFATVSAEDSMGRQHFIENLPHRHRQSGNPPQGKNFSYTNY